MRYIKWLEMRVSHDVHPLFPVRMPDILPITYAGPWKGGDGPSVKDIIRFQARRYPHLKPGVAGWSARKLNNDSRRCLFSSLAYYNFLFLAVQFYFIGSAC